MLFGTGEGVATTTPLRIWWSTLPILLFQSQSIGIFANGRDAPSGINYLGDGPQQYDVLLKFRGDSRLRNLILAYCFFEILDALSEFLYFIFIQHVIRHQSADEYNCNMRGFEYAI